MTFISFCKIEL